ncbi:glycosyl hydrolase family 95 catalytic domain-containing protein [Microbacterium hydrocarbonoxydans]|uniref:glycosyl hydrolase family 95 catalytic domain-containing protein n=1 Tax=Microbacterium hydrocarbonoxydans TaxID=273678 RepID=UPI0020408DC4|nr:glycoside hydrolase N-terminal domain-containing protein [Microbacterium hydrocarbonoxydans]MCM3779219.1 glycoside hydrolase family 95 protein [Microbacterium hydrocarbonoxydans]
MSDTLRLTWDTPASRWDEATPLGNGRIGAMAFGGSGRYQLNDSTAWSGTPDGPARALDEVIARGAGPERLAEVRAALDAGDVRLAEDLLMAFEGPYSQEFLPLADLRVDVLGAEPVAPARVLDIDEACLLETLSTSRGHVRRRSWASAPAQALLIELTSDEAFDVDLALSTPLHGGGVGQSGPLALDVELPVDGAPLHEVSVEPGHRYADDDADPESYDAFAAIVAAIDTDGEIDGAPGRLAVRRARRLLIALSTSSRAESWWADADGDWRTASREAIRDRARERADAAVRRAAADLLAEHIADRRRVTRARFAIGSRREGTWSVDRDVLRGDDPALRATVAAEYGMYLLASSSRAGSPAANLQGIWNAELRPAWSSNYTININTEMNYWAAPVLHAPDVFEPLLALVEHLAATGGDVARRLYGARGWVAHHNSDVWGWTLPVGNGRGAASWAIWMMGGVWLTHNLWDAYEFSGDRDLLRARIWPLLRGAAEFCLDWLVEGDDGLLRTAPSTSPENSYVGDDGAPTPLGLTAACDLALIGALLSRTLRAIEDLGLDDALEAEIRDALGRLAPLSVGTDGRLLEWGAEVREHEPLHRHLSPVVGLYPLDDITPEATPELFDAAVRFLDARGPGAMGWSWAWKIALRARAGQGDVAASLLEEALTPFDGDSSRHGPVDGSEWGGLLPNLFSTHPPFQIDGNLGFPAGIAELLVQSHTGEVHLLPALPSTWPDGDVQGIAVRSGLVLDLTWSDGRVTAAALRNAGAEDRTARVRVGDRSMPLTVPAGGTTAVPLAPAADMERTEDAHAR